MTELACSIIGAADVDGVVALMQRIGVHFGGSKKPRVLEAVARDGVDHPGEVVLAVGKIAGTPRALVVAFTERSKYWRKFAGRHPRAALSLARHRLMRKLRRPTAPADVTTRIAEATKILDGKLAPPGSESWSDESPKIAKVMYVAVDPATRGGGAGVQMYGWFFRHLHAQAFTRCDAQVSADNVAAVKLHLKFPFRFIESHGGYFLWLVPNEVK